MKTRHTIVALALAAAHLVPAAARAQNVINITTGATYSSLNSAVTGASTDDQIVVAANHTMTGIGNYSGKTNLLITGSARGTGAWVDVTANTNARAIQNIAEGSTVTFENINFLGNGMQVASSAGIGIAAGGGTTSILGSYSMKYFNTGTHGGLFSPAGGVTGNILFGTAGGTVEFSNNTAGVQGGALRGADFTFDANAIINYNKSGTSAVNANSSGGAIYTTGNLTFSGSATIKGNSNVNATYASGNTGGAIHMNAGASLLRFKDNALITENYTVNGHGGAVRANGDVRADAGLVVTSNTAGRGAATSAHGGAFYVQGDITVAGITTATGNTAASSGGAFYLQGSGTFNGGSTFTANTASTGNGGAIYWNATGNGTLTLDANTAGITFRDNTAGGNPNAIYIASAPAGNTNTLDLRAAAGNTIAFYDPIATGAILGRNLVTISGSGAVLFDTAKSNIHAETTVNTGATLRLANGAIYGASDTTGAFTLATGATLSGNGAINTGSITIRANTLLEVTDNGALALTSDNPVAIDAGIRLAGSGTLDLRAPATATLVHVGALAPAAPNTPQTLTLATATPLTIATGGTIAIDLYGGTASDHLIIDTLAFATGPATVNLLGTSGTYAIITANNTTLATTDFNLLVNGAALTARYTATPTIDTTVNTGLGSTLVIDFSQKNLATTWAGTPSGTLWKNDPTGNGNWIDNPAAPNPETYYVNGDSVTFNDTAAAKTVTIDAAGVTAADMTVANTTGNDYTFAGSGGITTNTTTTLAGSAFTPTGKLTKTGAGTLTFANTAPNTFAEGIDHQGGVIAFADAAQLGDGGKGITITTSATLRPTADNVTIANTLNFSSPAATAAIDIAEDATATYAGTLAGATGTLAKTGAGTLRLTTDNSAFAGAIHATAGDLLLDGGKLRDATIAPGATFGGTGTAAHITSAADSTLQVGLPGTTGALYAGAINLAPDTTLNYTILAGNQSSTLHVPAAAVTLAGAPSTYNLNMSAWLTGTYNLGNVTALATAPVIYNNSPLNTRQTYNLSNTGGILQLVINQTANAILVWDGTSATTADNGLWNSTAENWFDAASPSTRYGFSPYDSVTFDDRVSTPAYRTIDLPATNTVSDIAVGGAGPYTFTGAGGITTDTTGVYGIAATGKLTKTGPGTLTFQNTGGNTFQNGITIGATGATGGVIEFTDTAQLATPAITFLNTGTLRSLGATGTLAAPIALANAIAATLDIATGTLTYAGAITTPAATGTLAKTGPGALRLAAAATTAASITTNVAAGSLLLDNATLAGPVNLSPGALLAGAGSAAAVNAAPGSAIHVGPGALAIASLQLAGANTLAGAGTLSGAATLNGPVTADIAPADTLTLSGANTGSGSILKTGAGDLVYTTAAALGYTGGTQIDDGYVLLRGITGADATALSHTITLNGGWLDLSDTPFDTTGSTANNWTALNIIQGPNATAGGVIGGNDMITLHAGATAYNIGSGTKTGLFVVVTATNGTATLTGTNLYMGYTRVDSGTLKITADAQLGATTGAPRPLVLNGGALQLSGTGFTTNRAIELRADGAVNTDADVLASWNGITNTGTAPLAFTKVGTGTLAIRAASAAAVTNINEGRYIATAATAAGRGEVNVAAPATLELRTTGNATVANAIRGAGTLVLANTTGTLTLNNTTYDIAAIVAANNANILLNSGANPMTFGAPAGTLRIDNARISIATTNSTLNNVTLANNATLGFALTGTTNLWRRATLATLSGAGNLALNTNLGLGFSDQIAITTAVTGSYNLIVTNTGANPVAATPPVTLITLPAGAADAATFTVPGGQVQAGLVSYDLVVSTDPAGASVQLVTAGRSNTGQLVYELAGTQSLSWFSELESVTQRMGELHFASLAAGSAKHAIATWIRAYGQRINYDNTVNGSPFSERQIGATVGADYRAGTEKLSLYLGGFVGYGQNQRTLDTGITGDAKSNSAYIGLYATLATAGGWYIDGVLKGNRIKNEFNATIYTGGATGADYDNDSYGASIEIGKTIKLGKGWFIEPQAQATYTQINGADYTTSDALAISIHDADTEQVRGGLRVGRTFETGFGELFQIYAKAYYARQWTTGGRIYIDGARPYATPKIEGNRFEAGAGIAWLPTKRTQVFFDYEGGNASDYNKPWGLNGGVRYSW